MVNRWVLNVGAKNSDRASKDLNLYHILSYCLIWVVSLRQYILLFQILFLIFKDDVVLQVSSLSYILNMGFQYMCWNP